MQLKKLMIEVMVFFVLGCFLFVHVERQKIRLEKQQKMRTKRL